MPAAAGCHSVPQGHVRETVTCYFTGQKMVTAHRLVPFCKSRLAEKREHAPHYCMVRGPVPLLSALLHYHRSDIKEKSFVSAFVMRM
jgi:hypothetical protein